MARGFRKVFYVNRKPGKSSPKSIMFYPKYGPRFSKLTKQQENVRDAGKKCGALIRGKFPGSGGVKARRSHMGACIRAEFGKPLNDFEEAALKKIGY